MKISVVSPIYKGEKMLDSLVSRCIDSLEKITDDYEIILVNDSSPDDSWSVIKGLCSKNKKIKGVDLSRNFGQHPAISAGLSVASGDWIVVMDCDLQDRPEEIPKLYEKALEGWDIVYARRAERKDKFLKKLSSTFFHIVYDSLSGIKTDKTIANFGIYKRSVIREILNIPDRSRGFSSLLNYVGFKHAAIDVQHSEREEGKSSYTLSKLLKAAADDIIADSNKPLHITLVIGFVMSFISFVLAIYNVIAKICGIVTVEGFTTTVFSIWFIGGLLLFVLGIIGIYIGRIYDQVKGRPYMIIRETVNTQD